MPRSHEGDVGYVPVQAYLEHYIEDEEHGSDSTAHNHRQHSPRPHLPYKHAPFLSPQPTGERGGQRRGRGGTSCHVGHHIDARAAGTARERAWLWKRLASGREELHERGVD